MRPTVVLVSGRECVLGQKRPGDEAFRQAAVAASVSGLEVITWTDKGLTYALASDLAVTGSKSCMVCHGSAAERRKFEGL